MTLLYAAAFWVWARKRACAFPRIPKTSPISPIRSVSIGQALCGQWKRNVSMTSTEAVKFLLVDDIDENISALEALLRRDGRSEEHTSELQSLMRTSYDVFCLKKNNQ